MDSSAPGEKKQSDKPVKNHYIQGIQTIATKYIGKYLTNKKLLLPAGIFVFLLLFIPVLLLVFSKGNTQKPQITPNNAPSPSVSPETIPTTKTGVSKHSNTLVYGTWLGSNSIIKAVDLDSATTTILATLPQDIRKMTVLSNNTLLYIDETDQNDNGARISIYNLAQKQITTSVPAASGFVIDDYVLSPDNRYIALWEVQYAPHTATPTLQGGDSRVYLVDLTQPTITNLLYDEPINTTIPVHYPRAVLNDGLVFTDTTIPNDPSGGTGWAYGMSTVNPDGSNKQDVTTMTNGTYGSQPSLSTDGKFLLFAGYDGSNGSGTTIKNGYRQALLTPNTVELMDTTTQKRFVLPNLPDTNIYSDVQWDKITGNVIISILSSDVSQMGVYSYDLGLLHTTKIQLPLVNGTSYGYITQLSNNKTLIGIQNTTSAYLGNLGQTYSYAYSQVSEIDGKGSLTPIVLPDPFIQYITILPQNYFNTVLGDQTTTAATSTPQVTYGVLQGTQNNQFPPVSSSKPSLATIRAQLISNPANSTNECQNLGLAQCGTLGFTQGTLGYTICQDVEKANDQTGNACY